MTQKSESVREAEQRRTALYEVNLRWPVKANDRGAILTTPVDIAQFAESYAKVITLKLAGEAEQNWVEAEPSELGDITWHDVAAWLREKAR